MNFKIKAATATATATALVTSLFMSQPALMASNKPKKKQVKTPSNHDYYYIQKAKAKRDRKKLRNLASK